MLAHGHHIYDFSCQRICKQYIALNHRFVSNAYKH